MCGCLPSIVKKFPTKGRPSGPGGKLAGFLCLIQSAIKRKRKINKTSAFRSKLSKKLSSHMMREDKVCSLQPLQPVDTYSLLRREKMGEDGKKICYIILCFIGNFELT